MKKQFPKKLLFIACLTLMLCILPQFQCPALATGTGSAKVFFSSPQTITGFADYENELYYSIEQKPDLDTLLSQLPGTLDVYLNGSNAAVSIPVTWYCVGDDYENSCGYYFQFSPQWDEEYYLLAEDLDPLVDAPYVAVFFTSVQEYSQNTDIDAAVAASTANANTIFNFLVNNMNLNAAGACGILANIYYESGFNPSATNRYSGAYGICQWYSTRKIALINWCRNNGYSYSSLTGQLNYLKKELSQNNQSYLYNGRTIYNRIASVANSTTGAYNSGYQWCYYYEIPANKSWLSIVRGNMARNTYWPRYKSSAKISLTSCTATISCTSYVYNGSARNPGVTVRYGSKTLKKDTDYQVTYSANTNPGQATVKIKGINTYTGEITKTFSILPKKPVLSKVSNVSNGVKITYKKSTGASGYYIYRKIVGGDWKKIATISSGSLLSYTDKTARSGQKYLYTVAAYNSLKQKSSYNKNGLPITCLAQAKMQNLDADEDRITVKWSKVTGAQGYRIYRKAGSASKWTRVKTIRNANTTSWADTNVTNGTKYIYTVRAYTKTSGNTEWGSYNSRGKTTYCLSKPSISSLKNTSSKKLTVEWSKNIKAAGYRIQYSTNRDFSNKTTITANRNSTVSTTIPKLTKNKKYYVRVSSYKKSGSIKYYSEWSKIENLKITT